LNNERSDQSNFGKITFLLITAWRFESDLIPLKNQNAICNKKWDVEIFKSREISTVRTVF
jgi:hypothetical protein